VPGLYVHIPFCERKCIYCSFYSLENHEGRARYLAALPREIAARAEMLEREGVALPTFTTIFLGGGTPSLLSPEEIGGILDTLRSHYTVAADAEVTMECNPGALAEEWLPGYRDRGINRLSFGVQSFHDDELQFLSRIHTAREAEAGVERACSVFENVSLDLIFALPLQTLERWRYNLERAIALGTSHLSAYSLIFEGGTRLEALRRAGAVQPAPEDREADMYTLTMERMAQAGFAQYEVSNYARNGRRCQHNLGYWERQTSLAFGPSAHGFIRESRRRYANAGNLEAWLTAVESGRAPEVTNETVGTEAELEEIVFLGLRSLGIDRSEIRRVAGSDLSDLLPDRVARLQAEGFAVLTDERLRLTARGYSYADRLALEIIHELEQTLLGRAPSATTHVISSSNPSDSIIHETAR